MRKLYAFSQSEVSWFHCLGTGVKKPLEGGVFIERNWTAVPGLESLAGKSVVTKQAFLLANLSK